MLNFMAVDWPQQGLKKDTIQFGKPICNPWSQCSSIYLIPDVNVLAFISNLGPNNKPKMLKVGPKFVPP
jgi:hypothetical protein